MDEIDTNRAKVYALIYLMSSVKEGMIRIHPDIHGIYETWDAAMLAKNSKCHPGDYYISTGSWRKVA